MQKIAYIFPGQGSQYVGMGKDLFAKDDKAKDIYRRADGVLGFSLSKICFEGPEEELKQTKNTQPAIFLHSMALLALIEQDNAGLLGAAMAAGHSLGEYSALVFAGVLTFEEGLRIVRLRGELMQKAGEEQEGTMAAVVGLEPDAVNDLCRDASVAGIVQGANFNSPGQIVISGSVAGVHEAMKLAKARGAKLVKELVVSGAFHSPLMQSAREGLCKALNDAAMRDARIPVYANVTGKPVKKAEEIRTLLNEQLTCPVLWETAIRQMIADRARTFVEIGPGKVLQGLAKRIDGSVEVKGIDKYEELDTLEGLKAND